MSSASGQLFRTSSNSQNHKKLSNKTDFMQTQTFHRRNLSNLINMKEEEEVPDHMLISRGGPARRTLEQIEQGSNYAYGEEGSQNSAYETSLNEIMNSQDSAADNDFQDLNSNFHPGEPQMPKGGFFNMVEHPSILDDEEDAVDDTKEFEEDGFEDDSNSNRVGNGANEKSEDSRDGDFPMTGRDFPTSGRKHDFSKLRLDTDTPSLSPSY